MKFIYSHGGFAREFMRCVRQQYPGQEIHYVDDAAEPGSEAITYDAACALDPDRKASFVIGFAGADLRRSKTERVLQDGFGLFDVTATTAIVGDNVTLGEGAILSDMTILTSDARIGRSFHCNIYSYVAHDCVVGDFVTLAPRVSINGRVEIADNVYIGTGATVLPGKPGKPVCIGEGAVIGAHAMVTSDVEAGAVMVGVPAKPIQRKG